MIDKVIIEKKDCVGCYSCASVCPKDCIDMKIDDEGFWYPHVDNDKCIKCNKCVSVCPTINTSENNNKQNAYACINKEESIRLESSSGGVFSLVAEQILEEGGAVFGACFDSEFVVKHSFTENKEKLKNFRGSKYTQSKIGDSYRLVRDFLKSDQKVLFTGTPCQVAGLKSFLGKEYNNLVCMDMICHGVPSPDVWKKYTQYREKIANSKVDNISFRNKKEGWKKFSVSFLFKNNTEYRQSLDKDLYMRIFLNDICLRPSCYDCKFKGLNRNSDITLADFWGIKNIIPEMDDDKGTSLIFVNSDKGKKVFEVISSKMEYKDVNIEDAVKYNPAAIKSASYNPKRESFMKKRNKLSFDKLVKKYCIENFSIRIRKVIKSRLRGLLFRLGLIEVVKKIMGKSS